VRQGERHTAAALGQLQSGVDGPADRLHIVLDAQQEAGDELTALLLAGIEEGRGGRLEAPGDDLVDELGRQRLVAAGEEERDHDDAVLEAFEVAFAVEGLERIRGVELEGTEEGLEAELLIVGPLRQSLDEFERVLFEDLGLVVILLDEVVELLLEVVEEDGVVVHVLQEVLPSSLLVTFELDPSALVIQVQHGVERVVVQVGLFADDVLYIAVFSELAHSLSNPRFTASTSS